jgi:hypothetical protein
VQKTRARFEKASTIDIFPKCTADDRTCKCMFFPTKCPKHLDGTKGFQVFCLGLRERPLDQKGIRIEKQTSADAFFEPENPYF